jgi:hypothetical protein
VIGAARPTLGIGGAGGLRRERGGSPHEHHRQTDADDGRPRDEQWRRVLKVHGDDRGPTSTKIRHQERASEQYEQAQ